MKKRYLYIAISVVLLSYVLRVYNVTTTSLWYDEIFVLTHAQHSLLEAVIGLFEEDNALPLHGLLLAFWVRIAGSGEYAGRYLSVLLGIVTTPLVIRLGGTLARNRYHGVSSGLVYATLPIFVYYTQEIRMYALTLPLAVAFAWMSIRLYYRGKNPILYTVIGLCMLAAHLYSGILWVICFLWGLCMTGMSFLRTSTHSIDRLKRWLFGNALLLVGSIPIIVWAVWRVSVDATGTSAIPIDVLRWLPVTFGIGQYIPTPWAEFFLVTMMLSIVMSIDKLAHQRNYASILWMILALLLPVIMLLGATLIKAKWSERYILPSFGLGLAISIGLGWDIIYSEMIEVDKYKKSMRFVFILMMCLPIYWIAGSIPAVVVQAHGQNALLLQDEWHPRPDFRGVAAYIERHGSSEDVVVVVAGYAAHTLAYYYDGPAEILGLPEDTRVLNTNASLDLYALQDLEKLTSNKRVLWLVLWQQHLSDPLNLVESALVSTCLRLPVNQSFTNISVLLFDLDSCRPLDRIAEPSFDDFVKFKTPIQFVGYDVQKGTELWEVDVWWKTTGDLDQNYTVFVHLVNAEGAIIGQHDHIAGSDGFPTSQWRPGTYLRDRFFLESPGDSCTDCVLHIGLYTDRDRLELENGDDMIELQIDG
ncbi:MAG: glycosyltransferase family 39 protein [Anaerolineae bacterium]|nr:glycosyltransferase family 39 protein [Anaerolineae bacterium]